jgi:hypothetical protein
MSACAWMIGLVLLAQVGSGNGRYPASGGTNPFSQGTPNSSTTGNAGGGGLVPIIEPSTQGAGAAPSASTPSTRSASPYGTSTAPLGSGGTYPPPGAGPLTTPPAGTSPWQTTPPAGGTAQTSAAGGLKSAAMMRAMLLVPPTGSRLPGTSISLADAVASASSRADQSGRVEAYWDLCSSVADYYLGVREQGELSGARGSRVGTTWQQAESELAARVATSQAAAVASQYRLASFMGMAGSMPLPADIPHCGDYHTRYEQIFAGRPTAEAQQLAALLPKRYAELKDAGLAVTRAEQWLNTTAARDSTDGVETVRALELLALRRRAFVQIARDYNRRIARYTELSTPGQVASERLIGMLIKSSGSATATRTSAPVPYNRQSQNAPSLPRTFDWAPASGEKVGDAALDEAIKHASGEAESEQPPREERSLLVNPQ